MSTDEAIRRRSLQILDAFPLDEPCIPITGLVGEVESDTARSIFQVCRLCGSLVLESMKISHLMAFNHDRDQLFAGITDLTKID